MEITAAVYYKEKGFFSVEKVDMDGPQADEVLVKIVATGMCHTDLFFKDLLPLPTILGHEGSGIVEQVGQNVKNVQPGDHVVLTYGSCGQCKSCLAGKPSYCLAFIEYNIANHRPDGSYVHNQNGKPIAGVFFYQSSFATHAIAHKRNVVKIPHDVPLELMGPLGCGVQTGVGAVLNCIKPAKGSSIAIFGIGAVGISAVMAAKVAGCSTIIAVDIVPSRLNLAKELGATHTINSKDTNAIEEIKKITTTGVDSSIDTSARPDVIKQAVEVLGNIGMCVLLGVAAPGATVTLNLSSFTGGRTVRGCTEGEGIPDQFIPYLISLYREGKLPLEKIVKFYNLAQINQAAEDSENGTSVKPIIIF
jgi:aryl-alcohol dehydrogenase